MGRNELVTKLLKILERKLHFTIKFTDYEQNRKTLRGICNQLPPMDLGEDFYTLQDQLLSIEREEKGVVDIANLEFKNQIAHFNGDITTIKADAIVNAANDQFLGCFVPCHNCIDNVIMSAAGFQLRNELQDLKSGKDYSKQHVKVTKAYNLPSKYIFHIAGPIVFEKLQEKQKQALKKCYMDCLDKAKENNLKSIVFCCISTGEYCFPNDIACDIAVSTVKEWLENRKYKIKVVFNTFKQLDKELYDERLSRENP